MLVPEVHTYHRVRHRRKSCGRYWWFLALFLALLISFSLPKKRVGQYGHIEMAKRSDYTPNFSSFAASCKRTSLRGLARPTVVVTTFGRKMLERKDYTGTIFERAHWFDTALWIYHEASWDEAHGNKWNMSKLESLIPSNTGKNRCVFLTFLRKHRGCGMSKKSGAIDQFYSFAGFMEPCDQPLRVKSGKLLVRKLAAMSVAVSELPTASIVIWLDSDVTFVSSSLDDDFRSYVLKFDVTFIPFTTNKQWDDNIVPNFQNSLDNPYWRIESGFVALQVTKSTKIFLEYGKKLYSGALLNIARSCLQGAKLYQYCTTIWLQRNLYPDDLYVLSLALHEFHVRKTISLGWFWYGCSAYCPLCPDLNISLKEYPYPHTCYGAKHVSPFHLGKYAHHWIGNGYYSS